MTQTAAETVQPAKKPGLSLLTQIFPFLKPYRYRVIASIAALLVTTLVTVSAGQIIRRLIDDGFVTGSANALNATLIIAVIMCTLMAVGVFARFYLVTTLGELVTADIRRKVFDHIVHLHPSYFEENRSGEIMSRLTTDTTLLQSIIGSSVSFALRSALMMTFGLIFMVLTNFKLSLIVLLSVPVIFLPIMIIGKKVRLLSKSSQDRIADVGTYAGEIVQQVKTVQSYSREEYEKEAFAKEVDQAYLTARTRIRYRSLLMACAIWLSFIAISVMIWAGGMDVLAGDMTNGQLGEFLFYSILVAMGVGSVSEVMGELQRAAGATERLIDLLNVKSLIQSPEKSHEVNVASDFHISLENLSFSYPTRSNQLALDNINLSVKPGETIALVGQSGAGKSTLFEILLRFYDPQQGAVKLYDQNVKAISLNTLREQIALVPQNPILFSNNVFYNIRYGNPDATDEQVIEAAKAANAHEFIEQLPQGYDSYLGENGVRLSGGQKQRVVIARAILKNPKILLLDEATSALDTQSEHLVQQALEKLMQNRTTFIIAHRLSTIKNADRIVVLDQGKIVDIGTEAELLASSQKYQQLSKIQFSVDEK